MPTHSNRSRNLILGLLCCLIVASAATIAAKSTPNPATKDPDGCAHTDTTFSCVNFLKNYDGDTITVDIPGLHKLIGKKVNVRLLGIDAPEIRGKNMCEKDAARAARKLVQAELSNAKRIDLKQVQRDKYFRILANVEYDGKNLADILIKNQLATPYDGGKKSQIDWCTVQKRPSKKP